MNRILIFFLLLSIYVFALPEERYGVGVYYKLSKFGGQEDIKTPIINIKYKNIYFAGNEGGVKFKLKDSSFLTPYIVYDTTEGFKSEKLDGIYKNLNDKNAPFEFGLRYEKDYGNLNFSFSGSRDFTSNGDSISFKSTYALKILEFLYFIPSTEAIYSDKKFTNYYYSITKEESEKIGMQFQEFNSSLRGKLELGIALFFSKNIGTYFAYNVEAINDKDFNHDIMPNLANKSFVLNVFYQN